VKPIASLSLDLDNKWSYLKTHGSPTWKALPSYLDVVVPRVLECLAARDLRITVFVVGQDAALEKNRPYLEALTAAGHEIGNHSFHHEPWLHLYSEEELEEELVRAEEAIEDATGQRPVGFRGPGFSLSKTTLDVLARRGYRYDASTLPTYLGPLARAYYFRTARLSQSQRRERSHLFGRFSDGFQPLKPYRWRLEGGSLIEIPVTTVPIVKTPVHVSYLLYLASFSPVLADSYLRVALSLCRGLRVEPSVLLHPLDFLGAEDARDLDFFPVMNRGADWKLERVSRFVDALAARFRVVPVGEHAERLAVRSGVPSRSWRAQVGERTPVVPEAIS